MATLKTHAAAILARYLELALGLVLAAALAGCSGKSNPMGSNTVHIGQGYPPSPYADPSVNPIDSTLAFSYAPLLAITRNPPDSGLVSYGGGYYYQFSQSGTRNWLASADGSHQRPFSPYYLGATEWTPDGRYLMYRGQNATLIPWNGDSLDFDARVELSGSVPPYDPKWNHAMTKIAGENGYHIYIWTAANDQLVSFGADGWRYPDWSPNDSMLAFLGSDDLGGAIMIADLSGSNPKVLVSGMSYLAGPKWSPDGSRIAFVGRYGNGDLQLWTVRSNGTGLTQLTTNGSAEEVAWTPSGGEVVYVHYGYSDVRCVDGEFLNGTIWRVNPVTLERHQMTFNAGLECP